MGKILIVDDELAIAQLISDALTDEGFETVVKTDAEQVYEYVNSNASEISLITLDIMMPQVSGIDLCRFIRNTVDCPIIFVTAKGNTFDKVTGLEAGADDYISKPFVVEEFVARIKAHLRREQRANSKPGEGVIKIGDIAINTANYEVRKGDEVIPFSTREFQLLQYLMENAGKVLSREDIFSNVWDTRFGDMGIVAVNIKSIRDKIDPDNSYIKTVWGVGYKFVRVTGIV